MNVAVDPERNEVKALLEFAGDLSGRRVLEVGAGYGRLTWRYASKAGKVVGIDPNPDKIARAKREMPADLQGRVVMLEMKIEDYRPDAQAPLFDLALWSWAL